MLISSVLVNLYSHNIIYNFNLTPVTLTLIRFFSSLLSDQNRVLHANSAACSVSSKSAPLKPLADHGNRASDQCKAVKVKTKSLNQISKINPLLSQLKYATDGMEAFIILFQRLTTDVSNINFDELNLLFVQFKLKHVITLPAFVALVRNYAPIIRVLVCNYIFPAKIVLNKVTCLKPSMVTW